MSQSLTVLMVEDDERLARFTAEYLEQNGVKVTVVGDGEKAVTEARASTFDAVVLDLMLPLRDGLSVCKEIRTTSDVPIIIVTARIDETDRVVGLEIGADDYLGKPFSPRELLARIRAVVRRAQGRVGPAQSALRAGPLTLHASSMTATWNDQPIDLTSYEFAILRVLVERQGRVLSREQILDLAKGSAEEAFDRSIDVRISRLRQKLGEDPKRPSIIRTVRGAGYMLAWDEGR
ncbi:MAG TPA: response regulator transcription factor [Polyangiaceae bacterium]